MKAPLSWLREWVDLPESPREIADRLTFSGTEVEGLHTIGGTFDGVVVGEVRSVEKHPNADKLTICRVFDGATEWQVVCGAPNVRAGGRYPFARIGVHLPHPGLTIEKRKVRGVESLGMLCAPDELGIEGGHAGLLTLDDATAAGAPLADILGPPETVFELEITPNRPDCLSIVGIARELAALYRRPLRRPDLPSDPGGAPVMQVCVEDAEGCPRYTARRFTGARIGPSPDWMRRRLEHAGVRSINNVVDITNYVMLETGHPLHAFDARRLAGAIVVRRARPGEKFVTLDGIERELNPSMLVIADDSKSLAIAGVMGGANSEIAPDTTDIVLEAAAFRAADIRATSRALGLSTESSYRFERGVNPDSVDDASRRAARLLAEWAGAQPVGGVSDIYPKPVRPRPVAFRFDVIRERSGIEASDSDIASVFAALEMPVRAADGRGELSAPTFRADVANETDLIEEFARVWGLEHVPAPPPRAHVDAGDDRSGSALSELRRQLLGLGLREIYNYSLVSESLLKLFGYSPERTLAIPNPISSDQSVLRPSLVPQMVETMGRNRARQVTQACLFEIGRVFDASGGENTRLCVGLMGVEGRGAITEEDAFLRGKGIWECLAQAAGIEGWSVQPAEAGTFEIRQADRTIGRIVLPPQRIRKEWRIQEPVVVLDVDAERLTASAPRPAFRPIPAFPSVERDVAFMADEAMRHEDVLRVMRSAAPRELERIQLFDIFRGPAIGAGRKSMAYALTYRSPERTLTDAEANGYHEAVKAALRRELAVEIRES